MSLWVMTQSSVVGGYQRLGLTCCLHLHAKASLHNYVHKVPVISLSNFQRGFHKHEVHLPQSRDYSYVNRRLLALPPL